LRLDQLPLRQRARIADIDWTALSDAEARRLQEFGFGEGVPVEIWHRGGWFGRGPIACRVGRMTVAIRRSNAAAISVVRQDQA
jgi:ferrous iron transport protein A